MKRKNPSRKSRSSRKKSKTVGHIVPSDEEITFKTRIFDFNDENLKISNHEQNHETAMMLHYLNSGLWRFKLDKIDTPRYHHEIQQEIRNEIPSAIEVEEMLHRFFKLRGMSHISQNNDISNKAPIYACGVCGICLPERGNWQFRPTYSVPLQH